MSATAQAVQTPVSPPIATPSAVATPAPILRTTGKLVFLRGKDLWVANLDGSGEHQITNGSLGAGYAGYTRDAAGHMTIYYTSKVAQTGGNTPSPLTAAEYIVYRSALEGGSPEKLLTFNGTGRYPESSSKIASVAPDGQHVVYTDTRGLNRLDLQTGQGAVLLQRLSCSYATPNAAQACQEFYEPSWSPRSDLVLVRRSFYDGYDIVGVRPLGTPTTTLTWGTGGEFENASSAPDGRRLCLVPYNAHEAVHVVDLDAGQLVDMEPILLAHMPERQPGGVEALSCAWSEDGRLAMQYILSTDEQTGHIAAFDASLSFVRDLLIPTRSVNDPRLVTWLPDGSGFIVYSWASPTAEPRASLVMLDGTARSLPVDANRVLGVLP